MWSPTPEYFAEEARIVDVLKELDLPSGVSYKFGHGSLEPEVSAFAAAGIKVKPREIYTTRPSDVVNFYSDKNKIVGRVYFTRDPVEVQSLDGMFAETETSLRERLGL